jgi:hypothetical protein
MKNLNRLALIAAFFLAAAPLFAAPNVEGDYLLFRESEPNGPPVAAMNFFNQKGSDFMVAGSGWGASGHLTGSSGYYDWNFTDGRKGRTTFTVQADGGLRGHVQGANNDINWKFVARKTKRRAAPAAPAATQTPRPADQKCQDCYDQQALKTKGCEAMNDLLARNACINEANAALSKCLETCVP